MKTRSYKITTALVLLALAFAAVGYAVLTLQKNGSINQPILLEGTIVTPDIVMQDGWILIQNGKISLVSTAKPDVPNAINVNTDGIIFPGLIDLHNHISYDVFPRWHPSHLFSDRYQWRSDPDFIKKVSDPYTYLAGHNTFCDMNTYGELRALVGGTTSILATANSNCIRGLVRNLDFSSGFYGFFTRDSAHIDSVVNLQPATDPAAIGIVKAFLADSHSEMFVVHLAEGVDTASLDEFHWFQQQGLLTRKTAVVQGVALGPAEFQALHQAGASLVWSPRSNIELYGKTADISAALDAGVRIAIAPDWGITGSSNLLNELHYAAQWNADHLSSRLTDQQLVEMVTNVPAQIAGIDDEVGAIHPGLFADLLVISGDRENPYRALTQAQAGDVQLVLIGGQPIYGTPALIELFWKASELNEMNVGGKTKEIRMPTSSVSFSNLVSELQAALAAQGTSLAPLTESR
jgi:cytosine/adenosine deaminase-related metal-dependent hydrolase